MAIFLLELSGVPVLAQGQLLNSHGSLLPVSEEETVCSAPPLSPKGGRQLIQVSKVVPGLSDDASKGSEEVPLLWSWAWQCHSRLGHNLAVSQKPGGGYGCHEPQSALAKSEPSTG